VIFRVGEPDSLAATEEEALCSFTCNVGAGAGGEKQWPLANLGE